MLQSINVKLLRVLYTFVHPIFLKNHLCYLWINFCGIWTYNSPLRANVYIWSKLHGSTWSRNMKSEDLFDVLYTFAPHCILSCIIEVYVWYRIDHYAAQRWIESSLMLRIYIFFCRGLPLTSHGSRNTAGGM